MVLNRPTQEVLMAEGGPRSHAEHARAIEQGLDGFEKAVKKLKEIGLTHEAAILKAGEMFDLQLTETDVAPQKNGKAKAPKRGR